MKSIHHILSAVAAGSLWIAGSVMAQQVPMPPPHAPAPASTVPATPSPAIPPPMSPPARSDTQGATSQPTGRVPAGQAATGTDQRSATFRAADGSIVTIHSRPSTPPAPVGPAPSFAQLDSNGDGSIDNSEASAYPLLANDFQYADGNDNRAVSKAEYRHWTDQP